MWGLLMLGLVKDARCPSVPFREVGGCLVCMGCQAAAQVAVNPNPGGVGPPDAVRVWGCSTAPGLLFAETGHQLTASATGKVLGGGMTFGMNPPMATGGCSAVDGEVLF
jgi:hypothetical protein